MWSLNLVVWDGTMCPPGKAYLGLLCVREINIYTLYTSGVFFLEQLSFTLVNVGLFLLLVCL